MPASIHNAKFVFLRRDGHRFPLQQPYEGPFEVVEAGDKTFKLTVGNRCETDTLNCFSVTIAVESQLKIAICDWLTGSSKQLVGIYANQPQKSVDVIWTNNCCSYYCFM